jgi:Phosphopantetheine attachment site.
MEIFMDTTIQIRDFIRETFLKDKNNQNFSDDISLVDSGIIDSLGILKVLMFIEKTFGFKVDERDVVPEYFENVNALAAYVDRHRSAEKS